MSDVTPGRGEPDGEASDRAGLDGGDHEHGGPRLPPIAYPVVGLAFGALLVWAFSRILLAVSTLTLHFGGVSISGKKATAVIALLVALNILVGAALVAYGRRVRRRPASFPLLIGAGALMVAGGFAALAVNQPSTAQAKTQAVALVAQGIKFQPTTLSFTAGVEVILNFENKDAGTQHNFVLFPGKDATGTPLFSGPLITGPASVKYTFKAPGPGTYFFHCAVHPTQMTGTATVTPGATQAGGGGGGPGLQVTAKGIAFSPTQLTAPSSGTITIHFNNQDAGTPHNIVVFDGTSATAPMLFKGPTVVGPASADYSFPAPPPGAYFFHCEFHPTQMTGTLTIR